VHILKFDNDYTRRHFMESAGKSVVGAGMLSPLWYVIARDGDIGKAYPDEALSIEHYSNGAVKPGGVIDASNVASVRHLMEPVAYMEVAQQGRVIDIKASETDIGRFSPPKYLEATLRNRGQARLDAKGNVVTKDGDRWIGGNPFPDGESARKIVAGHALCWSRRDVSCSPSMEWDLDANDNELFNYHFLFVEYMAAARTVLDPKPYLPGHDGRLKYDSFVLTSPQAVKGTSALNIWHYDQSKFPDFYGYLPDFKRVRRFTTNQRFEPNLPGSNYYPTDNYTMGDPYLTWGNFKLIGKVPFIGGVADRWRGDRDNWLQERVGGVSGRRFMRSTMELLPEVYVIEMEPVGFPAAPYSKKRVWFDPRGMSPVAMLIFDRKGQPFKNYQNITTVYEMPNGTQWPATGEPYWSWTQSASHNVRTDSISIVQQVAEIDGGFKVRIDDPDVYEQFCTIQAVRRLGK